MNDIQAAKERAARIEQVRYNAEKDAERMEAIRKMGEMTGSGIATLTCMVCGKEFKIVTEKMWSDEAGWKWSGFSGLPPHECERSYDGQ